MARPKKKKFGNALDEPLNPIDYQYGSGLGQLKNKEEAGLKVCIDQFKKLELLLDQYGLDPNDSPSCWILLSLYLANEHIAGFKIGKINKTNKVESIEAFLFYMLINEIASTQKISKEKAIDIFLEEMDNKIDRKHTLSDIPREYKRIKDQNSLLKVSKQMSKEYPDMNSLYEVLKEVFPNYKEKALSYISDFSKK